MRYEPFFCDKLPKAMQIKAEEFSMIDAIYAIPLLQHGERVITYPQPPKPAELEMLRVENQQRRFVKRRDDMRILCAA